jgi:putative peptidoglycan lipid II flippase
MSAALFICVDKRVWHEIGDHVIADTTMIIPWVEAHFMSLARHIATVGGGTLISRMLAYGRDAWIAALLGAGPFAEAFFAMLQVVNFFRRLLADGALNGAFVPVWLKLQTGDDSGANANRFTRRSLVAMLCIGGAVALTVNVFAWPVMGVIAPGFDPMRQTMASLLLAIAALYIALAGVVAVLAAALNAENRVGAVAASTIAFNLVMIAALAFTVGRNASLFALSVWLAGSIVVAGIVQLAITAIAWFATGKRWRRPAHHVPDETASFLTRAAPGLIAAGIPQLKSIAAAAIVSSSPAAVSWLYYANRLYELPLGVASIAIAAVIVPRIAASLRDGDTAEFAAMQSRGFEIALGLALPAAVGFALLAHPIAAGLFQRGAFTESDSIAVAAALAAICAGLPGHVLEKLFGAVSFAHGDTRTPMLTALCALTTAVGLGMLLFARYGYVGAAAAVAISGWAGAALLGAIVYARGWLRFDRTAAKRLPLIMLATAVMAVPVHYGLLIGQRFDPALAATSGGRLVLLGLLVTLGVIIYLAALQILGVARLGDMAAALRRQK